MAEVRAIAARLRFKPHVTPTAQRLIVETIGMQQGAVPEWQVNEMPMPWLYQMLEREAARMAEQKP